MSIRNPLTGLGIRAGALATAAPAAAETHHWGSGSVQGVTTVATHGTSAVTATTSGESVASTAATTTLAYQCVATGAGVTTSGSCYPRGADAGPGPTSVRRARALFSNGTFIETSLSCHTT